MNEQSLQSVADSVTTSTVAPSVLDRCPECSARRAPGASWCSQCFARFEVAPASAGGSSNAPAAFAAEIAEEDLFTASSWDERYRAAAEELDEETREAKLNEAMASLQAGAAPALSGSAGKLAEFTATAIGKIVLMAGGIAVLSSVGLLAMWILGHLV